MENVKSDPQNPESGRTGTQGGGNKYSFRCADVGFTECKWQTQGSSPEEVLRNAEQHGREKHNMTSLDENTRNKVRSLIRKAA